MTLTIGYWVFPLILTFVAFSITYIRDISRPNSGGYLGGLPFVFEGLLAIIFSLIVWLIWAVFT
jgi:hypothetical protein